MDPASYKGLLLFLRFHYEAYYSLVGVTNVECVYQLFSFSVSALLQARISTEFSFFTFSKHEKKILPILSFLNLAPLSTQYEDLSSFLFSAVVGKCNVLTDLKPSMLPDVLLLFCREHNSALS